ncbi:hypothetical protein J6590_056544 [Homalodisca vitripennis]|nr:hypothetical protein J6590_056544 [Homalodisca vitripennis]
MVTENEHRKSALAVLKKENHEIREEMTDLHQQIVGVPLPRGEDNFSVFERLAKVLNIPFDSRHVSVAHRLPLKSNQENPNIVVKFVRRNIAEDSLLQKCLNLGPQLIFINDHLTTHNKAILGRARQLVKKNRLAFAWTKDCRVYVKKTSQPDSPATLLRTLDDLETLVKC